MARAHRHPLWTAAPVRLAHSPGWLGLVLLAAALLVASVVAPGLFATSARTAALDAGLEAAAAEPAPGASADLRATWTGVLPATAQDVVLAELDDLPGYAAPALGATATAQDRRLRALVRAGESTTGGALFFHDGVVEALGGDAEDRGVWLPTDVADRLGVSTGDPVRVGLESLSAGSALTRTTPTTVAGTYETAPGSVLPAAAADLPGSDQWVLPLDPSRPGSASPLVIAAPAAFASLARAIDEEPLYAADLAVAPDLDPATADAAVAAVQRIAVEAFDDSSELAAATDRASPLPTRLELATGLPDVVDEAGSAALSAERQVGPYAAAGQVLAAALLVTAWVLVGRSRRREGALAAGLGVHPLAVAGLTVLELVPVAVLAAPVGVGLALLAIAVAGPPAALGAGDLVTGDRVRAGVGAGLVLVLPAVVALVGAVRAERSAPGRLGARVRAVPWELLVLVATAAVLAGVLSLDPARRADSPLTTVLPLLLAACAAAVVVRVAPLVRLPGARPGSPRWLATRRAAGLGRGERALTAVLAVTLGLFAYTLTVQRGLVDGADDKVAALVGAPSVASVGDGLRGSGRRALRPPVEESTLVWRQRVTLPPVFGAQELLTVDPATFAAVADWGSTGTLAPGRGLLARLGGTAGGVPVLLAGDTDREVGDRGTMEVNEETDLPYVVVGVLPAFPGSEAGTGEAAVIAASSRVFPLLPPTLDPRDPLAVADVGAFSAEVWSGAAPTDLREALRSAGLPPTTVATAAGAAVGEGLLATSWAAQYVVVLGLVVLLLALAVVLALGLRLADRDAVADVLLTRMGWRPRQLEAARTWEVVRAVLTAAAATALSTTALLLGPSLIDQVGQVLPISRPRLGVEEVAAVSVLAAVMVAAAALVGLVRARRRTSAEVLRGEG
ncbi:hypothetical protein GGQ22_05815 [Nocardioides sp. zg-579]|uniref:FtsX-like permease family protein n=1 Tax=Nocardioides marmotae TaxID=2663857 RepID=A0A6I3J5M8_9ACTN|nr:hypothetical protein [Nocardioides marmotae]MCR6030955.1 hypothetical protein [Gordonia jinghuaiqii]MTB94592.1 hypothetical protein [Nocardioides marmotae]QKE01397.1 hypothetical protein HPC71_10170 [Nocardioides marmotae]